MTKTRKTKDTFAPIVPGKVLLEVRLADGSCKFLAGEYDGMTAAWDAFLLAQKEYGEANVRPVIKPTA